LIILEKNASTGLAMIEAIEPEAEFFALAEQVDLAEKAFHDALVRRNEAQIAYLRQPNILSRKAFGAEKKAESIARHTLRRKPSAPTASSKTCCNFENGKP